MATDIIFLVPLTVFGVYDDFNEFEKKRNPKKNISVYLMWKLELVPGYSYQNNGIKPCTLGGHVSLQVYFVVVKNIVRAIMPQEWCCQHQLFVDTDLRLHVMVYFGSFISLEVDKIRTLLSSIVCFGNLLISCMKFDLLPMESE